MRSEELVIGVFKVLRASCINTILTDFVYYFV